jgi:hypothetical protein
MAPQFILTTYKLGRSPAIVPAPRRKEVLAVGGVTSGDSVIGDVSPIRETFAFDCDLDCCDHIASVEVRAYG